MKTFKVKILSTSDLHGCITPINYHDQSPSDKGFAKIGTLIKQEQQDEPTILIDNGDTIQGSPLIYYSSQIKKTDKNYMAEIINYLQYDVCVIGNHDFNYGMDYLINYQKQLNPPLISCNILKDNNSFLTQPYYIKQFKDGPKICVIGLTTQYIPNWEVKEHIKGLQFSDAYDSLRNIVQLIKEKESVDCIVVSYHGGIERELETGEATEDLTGENQGYQILEGIDDIDVLITGHQHRSLATNHLFGKSLTQVEAYGSELSKIELTFTYENKWILQNKYASILSVSHTEPCEDILKMTEQIENETQAWLDQPIGRIKTGHLLIEDVFHARVKKHPLVQFINEVQMEVSQTDISLTSLGNDIKGFSEEITMRDIISTYIYTNTLMVLEVSGQDIKDALEKTAGYFTLEDEKLKVSRAFSYPKPQNYNYDMYEGIDYEIHVKNPIGKRIEKLFYKGAPMNPDQKYHIVMNNYRANGGGNYYMFKNKKVIKEINTDMVELITNYIRKYKVIDINLNENFKVIY